jgi:uncharacterized RDD family membrane protein YckC
MILYVAHSAQINCDIKMNSTVINHPKLGLFRYLAVLIYDLCLLASILLLAGAIAVFFNAVVSKHDAIEAGNPFFFSYLIIVSFLFYGWFWTHGGQTLGMRAWKVFLSGENLAAVTWRQALIRFCVAIISWIPLGLGFWLRYFTTDKKSWHDRLSHTQLSFNPKSKNSPLSRLS